MANDPAKNALIRNRVVRSTLSNYVGKLITLGTGFFLTPFMLSRLGATDYGLWVLASSVVGYGALLDFGIASAITKYIAEYRAKGLAEEARDLIATALSLYILFGLVAIVLSALAAPLFPQLFNVPPEQHARASQLVLLSGVGVGLSIPCATTTAVLWGLHRFDVVNVISIIGTLLSAILTIAILLLGGGILGIVAAGIVITVVMQIPSIWLIYRVAPELHFGWRAPSLARVRMVFAFSSSLFILNVSGRLQAKTDEIVIGAFLPIASITPYAIAHRLSDMARILTDQFMKVLLPLASELHAENDRARLRSLFIVSTRLTIAIFLPIGGTLVALAGPILSAWVGPPYADYAYLVLILTLAGLLGTCLWPAGSVLQGMARHQPLAVISMATGIANLALSIALVQSLGLAGVALGTLIPTTLESLVFVIPYTCRVIGVSPREALAKMYAPALLPAVPMLIVLYALQELVQPSSWLAIIGVAGVGPLVYSVVYLCMGASQIERQTVRGYALSTIHLARVRLKLS